MPGIYKTSLLIALCLSELIFFPKKYKKLALPIAFRSSYYNLQSVIDCFEIQIEKPSDPVKQALTWSEYKQCNTIKYLIPCTPNSCVKFVYDGWGGRITDKKLIQMCGYFEKLPSGCHIMADRGFKQVEDVLTQRGIKVIRPPSVISGVPSTKEEEQESKRIAALRIHAE